LTARRRRDYYFQQGTSATVCPPAAILSDPPLPFPSPSCRARSTFRRAARAATLLSLASVGACARADAAPEAWPTRPLGEVVRWEGEIRPEENDEVLNVWPILHADPAGGFLVADTREGQTRLYDAAGRLRGRFGARGRGPAEFDGPVASLRLPSGEIAVADLSGKVAVFDAAGARLLRTFQTGLVPLYDAELLPDARLLLVGRGPDKAGPLLHLFDPRGGRITRRFFTPAQPRGTSRRGALTASFAEATVRGDTIAVVTSLVDTLYLFDAGGRSLAKVHIPFRHFRPLPRDLPRRAKREQTYAWLSAFSLVSHAFWAGDGSWLVQYQDRNGPEIRWRLLRMTRDGRRIFELRDTPQLLATDPDSGRLYFVAPTAPAPNVWSVARLRSR